ncbi:probable RNA methyltransferase CG11342 [Pararge aegeria]|uniref:RNA methyltransferase n=2 Tax=Pararge aegeria TaxID=116150 RepID=A0A8S4S208_9NEOP|nr:probable RNA methyltransferase CG11342 [Pararge aegeria]CAH2243445.1 jg9361 [Pararge aegeria aegeria]
MPIHNSELTYNGKNPGAVKFGNFINYYSFHPSKERTNNLDPKMFPLTENERIICLDIGCNTGELTKDLYYYLKSIYCNKTVKLLAIDIDPTLIERAKEGNHICDISFLTCDIVSDAGCQIIQEYKETQKTLMFDVIFCFSVTMWIHINNGDEELIKLLNFLKDNTRSLIIEPQPWKCYKNAQRRMKKSGKEFELYEFLRIRNNVDETIEDILNNSTHTKVFESASSSWNRKIQSYHLKSDSV